MKITTEAIVTEHHTIDTCFCFDNAEKMEFLPIKMKYLFGLRPGTKLRITVEEVKEKDDLNES